MGRAPCCDKTKVKRGPWSPEEDATLKTYIENHGTGGNWICLPQKAGLKRCGKSCRLRWLNYLRPDIKHGHFSDEEDFIICTLYNRIGSRWSVIASKLEGRTDNDVKNHWNTKLKKKYLIMVESISSMSSSGMVSPGTTFIDIGINNSYPSITSYDLNNFTAMTPTPSINYYHLDYNDHLMNDITNNVTPKLEYVEPYYPHNYLSAAAAAACTEGGGSSDLSGDNVIGAIVSENYDMNGMMSNNNVMDGYYFSGFGGFGNSTGSSTSNHHSDYHGHDHDHDHVVGTRNWCESVEDHRNFEAVNVDGYGTNYYDDDYNNIGSGGDRSMWECMGN